MPGSPRRLELQLEPTAIPLANNSLPRSFQLRSLRARLRQSVRHFHFNTRQQLRPRLRARQLLQADLRGIFARGSHSQLPSLAEVLQVKLRPSPNKPRIAGVNTMADDHI